MILYFADRKFNIIGLASTKLPKGLTVIEDLKTEDVETGVAVFECKIPFDKDTRSRVEECTEVGNYLLRSHDNENEFYTIIDAEIDTKKQEAYIYAEDAGLDLLNEVVGAYEADAAYGIDHYINKFAHDSGFVIGINEAAGLTRKLSWDGEATVTERIASVATQFGGYEISYSFDIDGLTITNKYINIHKERGQDNGIQLRLNKEIDRIITKKSIANLATALECVGGTPEDDNIEDNVDPLPITLAGYSYDDGDFYVSGTRLYSRKALEKWSRYLWAKEPNQISGEAGHIVKQYSYDTLNQATLCAHAVTELKKACEMEVNYEVDFTELPAQIGDWVNIVDDAGSLYMAARVLLLETSVADQTKKATLGEYLIKSSGISQKVVELAAQFAKTAQSAARALAMANKAKALADAAQAQSDAAIADAANAQKVADEATAAANIATESAEKAQKAADNAQAAVDTVENSVASLENTVNNAQQAADNANQAAETAQAKADEAARAAANAIADAADAKAATEVAQSTAETAITKADTAQSTAETAKSEADTAKATADAAKLDAEKAAQDIDNLANTLETVQTTMQADYARKTDLTEAEASLQSQISQNAAQIASTVSKMETIDETANNAQEQAQAAQAEADLAKAQANQATADALAAQTAADNAAQAAANAQSEADTAKAAAQTAQSVADKAEADLEAAKADLATVSSRVDATEEEITAAQEAVESAQTAADKAKADAQAAATKAAQAQSTADTAVTNAANAKTAADDAAEKANLAQATADAAKGDAATAQAKANEAAQAAADAQSTANTAVTNAANAQAKADQAAADAATAQQAADDADARAAQAESDLATAQQNLANVTSRVGATEAEVEAAQAAVATAQAAADKAQEEAEAAQATADTAKANAATAQTAANNAKTAADKAQAAADEAQQAADDAQAAVDALAVRVTTAETKITQNSEQIALMATKTEVTETLGGYYTKEEADAAIKVSADAVKTTVSNTYATKTALATTDTKAANAATAAANAQNTADDAADAAEAAQSTADTAKANAATAQSTANTAKTNAATAQSTANTAKANAATAQSTADTAKANAATAQSTADTAKANAATAQTAANNAKTAADNAQASADEANEGVAALEERVTDAETSITQNADAIALRATKTELSTVSTAANSAQSTANTALNQSIEYIAGTQTAATNAWTGVTTSSSLYVGKTIAYRLPYAGTSSAATLNLTLSTGSTTGAKALRRANSTVTTQFPAGTVITLTYDGTYWRTTSINADTYDRTRYSNAVKVLDAGTAYPYIMVGTASGYKIAKSGVSFDVSYPVLAYNSSTDLKAGGTTSNMYTQLPSTTLRNNVASWTGTQYAMVYLVGTLSGKTFTINSTVFTTTTPTSANGLAYIPIGVLTNTYQIYFKSDPTVYAYGVNGFAPVAVNVQDNLAANYYTKTETEAQITVASDSIKSTVSATYATKNELSNMEVGTRNLIRNSNNLIFENYYFRDWAMVVAYDGAGTLSISSGAMEVSTDGNGAVFLNFHPIITASDDGNGVLTITGKELV